MKQFLASFFLIFSFYMVLAQDYQGFGYDHLLINKRGMYILGTWGIANIVSGGVSWKNGAGENKYFHQMNLMWNTVNISIAVGALISIAHKDYSTLTNSEILSDQIKSQKLFMINAGLDLVYIGGGLLLKKIGERKKQRRDLMKGYGNSIMLQGGFLLVFDGIFYFLQQNHRMDFLQNLSINLSNTGYQLGYTLGF